MGAKYSDPDVWADCDQDKVHQQLEDLVDARLAEFTRIQEKIAGRWTLCRLCWHVTKTHHLDEETLDYVCYGRNLRTPLCFDDTPTFFDSIHPFDMLRSTETFWGEEE